MRYNIGCCCQSKKDFKSAVALNILGANLLIGICNAHDSWTPFRTGFGSLYTMLLGKFGEKLRIVSHQFIGRVISISMTFAPQWHLFLSLIHKTIERKNCKIPHLAQVRFHPWGPLAHGVYGWPLPPRQTNWRSLETVLYFCCCAPHPF